MTAFMQLLVLGMATGGFYTINALGLVTVFRSSGVINFASGGIAMVGRLPVLGVRRPDGLAAGGGHTHGSTAVHLLGTVVYVVAIRPLSRGSTLTMVIATLAVLVEPPAGDDPDIRRPA